MECQNTTPKDNFNYIPCLPIMQIGFSFPKRVERKLNHYFQKCLILSVDSFTHFRHLFPPKRLIGNYISALEFP